MTMIRKTAFAMALAATAFSTQAAISPGHWEVWGSNTGIQFGLYQDQADTDITFLYADVETTVLNPTTAWRRVTGSTFSLDSAADLYLVQPGQLLTNALLESRTYPAIVGPTNATPHTGQPDHQPWPSFIAADNQELWIGARIRSGNIGDQPWTGFGWAHLRFEDNGSITLLGSAMAYGESSLVVGAVPEPGAWALMCAGLGLVGLAVRRKRIAG